jgi:hypothetical protein
MAEPFVEVGGGTDRLDGALRKVLDVTRMEREPAGWTPPTDLKSGLARTISGTGPTRPRLRPSGGTGRLTPC